jgi:hypothetical protein
VTDVSQPHSSWEEGREPGRRVVVLGAALALTAVGFDLAMSGRLTLFSDLSFIVACLALAVAVRPHDFFTVGVLPPLLMVAAFALLGAVRPETIADPRDGVVQATVTGLAHHSGALVVGYLLCLATLGVRRRQRAVTPRAVAQASNRAVSPAP